MNFLTTALKALEWQGGTLWDVISECHNRANIYHSTYQYGVDSYKQWPARSILELKIPVNSWDSDSQCTINFIAGYCKAARY